jgi:RNA polymerase sigma-70 factor (ECF subfamily)
VAALSELFLAAIAEPAQKRIRAEATLEASLRALCDSAGRAWPELELPAPELVRFLGERVAPDANVAEALSEEHVSDLALAFACATGDEHAIGNTRDAAS